MEKNTFPFKQFQPGHFSIKKNQHVIKSKLPNSVCYFNKTLDILSHRAI